MARWDDLRRAVKARDIEGAERIWFELIEADPSDPTPFLEVADLMSRQTGGRREASSLLSILADALKERGLFAQLLPVYTRWATYQPDEGTLRADATEAARKAWSDRSDLEVLLEKSKLAGPSGQDLPAQIQTLERLLRIEKDAWVFHKSGWGVGRVVEYHPERGRCVIDFRGRKGHEMDVEAAANLLERLAPDDIRVQAVDDPAGLKKRAKDDPLEMIRQVLMRFGGSCKLANVKDALVPDAVSAAGWSAWWNEAKRRALLDPRFEVGQGRDPRLDYQHVVAVDFASQVEMALKRSATVVARQKAVREMLGVAAQDERARDILLDTVRKEIARSPQASARAGWEVLQAELLGRDPVEGLAEAFALAEKPQAIVSGISDATVRGLAARALVRHPHGGPRMLIEVAAQDDPIAAEVAAETLTEGEGRALLDALLERVDEKPALLPNLYAWMCKRIRRGHFPERAQPAYDLQLRILKVLDAVAYRLKRDPKPSDKQAAAALVDVLLERNGRLMQEAVEATNEGGARHLVVMLEQNRGLLPRALSKLQNLVLRAYPGAMRDAPTGARDEAAAAQAALRQIYMTAEGQARLKAEYERIAHHEIPENSREIARAREFGDLRENAEYHAAREKQGLLQAKADQLKADLARSVVLTPEIVRTDAVSVGTRVRLKDADGHDVAYTLLGPPDTDPGAGIINYLTPLGQVLMGRKAGEDVTLEVDGEVRHLRILEIQNALVGAER